MTRHQAPALLLSACLAVACGLFEDREGARDYIGTMNVDFLDRTYRVHVPPSQTLRRPAPLVLMFHGLGINAAAMEEHTGFNAAADAAGIIVVYPESILGGWDSDAGTNDLRFARLLIGRMQATHDIDETRIVAAGLSNGANFVQRLGCELPDRIAGFVAVAGTMLRSALQRCALVAPEFPDGRRVNAAFILGSEDQFYPMAGSSTLLSADSSLGFWAAEAGCSGARTTMALADTSGDGTTVYRATYQSCGGLIVRLDSIVGGGHAWPGALHPLPEEIIGVTSRNASANGDLVEFVLNLSPKG